MTDVHQISAFQNNNILFTYKLVKFWLLFSIEIYNIIFKRAFLSA